MFSFNLRLFAIVLSKMLLFGQESLQLDLLNWKTGKIDDLPCDKQSYLKLIEACFFPNITTPYIVAFVRSVCLYELAGGPITAPTLELDSKFVDNLSISSVFMTSSVTALSALSPEELFKNLEKLRPADKAVRTFEDIVQDISKNRMVARGQKNIAMLIHCRIL
jgi:hypothetical protein